MRKLYRHTHGEKRIATGVFAGLGDWLEVTPGILRVGFIVLTVLSGIVPGILLYFALTLMMKKHPEHEAIRDIE